MAEPRMATDDKIDEARPKVGDINRLWGGAWIEALINRIDLERARALEAEKGAAEASAAAKRFEAMYVASAKACDSEVEARLAAENKLGQACEELSLCNAAVERAEAAEARAAAAEALADQWEHHARKLESKGETVRVLRGELEHLKAAMRRWNENRRSNFRRQSSTGRWSWPSATTPAPPSARPRSSATRPWPSPRATSSPPAA